MTDVSVVAGGLSQTVPVYWKDSYQSELKSRIVKAVNDEKRYWYVALDETIFHPKGGGQPSDRGIMEGDGFKLEVKKAMLAGDRVVVHWGKTLEGMPSGGSCCCQSGLGMAISHDEETHRRAPSRPLPCNPRSER